MRNIKFKLIILFASLLFISAVHAQDRYWVNGSGNWNDTEHWSEISGGAGGATIPNSSTVAIIDKNSSDSKFKIEIYTPVYVKTIKTNIKDSQYSVITNDNAWIITEEAVSSDFDKKVYGLITTLNNTNPTKTAFSYTVTVDIPIACNGDNNGQITIDVTGGTPDYTYRWLNIDDFSNLTEVSSSTTHTFSGLKAGTYAIRVVDFDLHQVDSIKTLTQPDALSMVIGDITITDVSCAGQTNGKIEAVASGGTLPYTYSIAPAVQANNADGVFDNLATDTYTITVNDANTCGDVVVPAVFVDEPDAISFIEVRTHEPTCFGGADGSVVIKAEGGYNLEYSIDNGTNYQVSDSVLTSAGSYTILVRDQTFTTCSAVYGSNPVVVTEPAQILISSTINQEITCFDADNGEIQINITQGSVGALELSVDNGAYAAFVNGGIITNLTPGDHYFQVRDANGCESPVIAENLTEPAELQISSAVVKEPTCSGSTDGEISVTVTAGNTSSLELSVNSGTFNPFTSGGIISGLGDGVHKFQVRNANLCVSSEITDTLTEPVAVVIVAVKNNDITCFQADDGSVNISITGGVTPFTISVDGAGAIAFPGDGNITGLDPGTHRFEVIDANGCVSNSVDIDIDEPGPIVISSTVIADLTCFGSDDGEIKIDITPGGGTAPFQISVDAGAFVAFNSGETIGSLSGGSHVFQVEDVNGCQSTQISESVVEPSQILITLTKNNDLTCYGSDDGSVKIDVTNGTAPFTISVDRATAIALPGDGNINGLSVGEHTFKIIDINGCESNESTVNFTEPLEVVISSTVIQNLTCNGSSDGQIQINVTTGGIAPFTLSVDSGAFNAFNNGDTITGLTADNYTFQVQDANTCPSSVITETLTEPEAVFITATKQGDISCFGASNGEVKIEVTSGGIAPFTISVDGAADVALPADGIISNLSPDDHEFQVTDANSCESNTPTVNIGEPTEIVVDILKNQDLTCFESNDGIISVSVLSGGTAPFTVSLNNGSTYLYSPGTILNLAAQTYDVIVQDINGCTSTPQAITVDQPDELTATIDVTDISCSGSDDGKITINAVGGTTSYQYSINDGFTFQPGNEFPNLIKGAFYSVKVEDFNGCEYPASGSGIPVTINEPDQIVIDSLNQNNVSCHSGNNGKIILYVSGGVAPLEFSIDAGATWQATGTFSGLTADVYTVLIQDANSCQITRDFTITEPNDILLWSISTTDLTCFESGDGSLNVIATGGTGQLEYSLDGITFQTSNSFSDLDAGDYDVYARDDNNCIKIITTVTVNEPPEIIIDSYTIVDLLCNTGANGELTVNASGGTGSLYISLDGGANQTNGFTFTGLTVGDHLVSIKDDNCSKDTTFTIGAPDPIVFDTEDKTDITCNGDDDGTITLVASGGTPPFEYSIDGGTTYGNTTGIYSALIPGDYQVSVIDDNGCELLGSLITIIEPAPVSIDNVNITHLSCNGDASGEIEIIVSGGTTIYQYSIDNGTTFQTENIFTGLDANTFNIVVKDENDCSDTDVAVITEPAVLQSWKPEDFTHITTCFGDSAGTIFVHATGGTSPYEFSVKGSGGPFQTDSSFVDLPAGDYNVYVRDANGCELTGSDITLTEPSEIAITYDVIHISSIGATDGEITIHASGGTPIAPNTYQYSIDRAGTWTVALDQDSIFTGLGEGWYYLAVQDGNSCVKHGDSIYISPLTITEELTHITCNGDNDGEINVSISDGVAPYTIEWTGPNGFSETVVRTTEPSQDTISNLEPGTYTIQVTDDAGNIKIANYDILEPDLIAATFVETLPTCNGTTDGAIDMTVTGGTSTYTFLWNNGEITEDLSNIPAGSYSVDITDANLCTYNAVFDLLEPAPVTVEIEVTNPLTTEISTDGEIRIVGLGGTPNYDITLIDIDNATVIPPFNTLDTARFNNLAFGNYYAEITDANGCGPVLSDTVLMTNLGVSLELTNITCFGDDDGMVVATILGGKAPFTYTWITGDITADTSEKTDTLQNLSAQTISVVITDDAGSSVTSNDVVVIEPDLVNLTHIQTDVTCYGLANGTVDITVAGGTGLFTYVWSGPNGFTANVEDTINLKPGDYEIIATDINACDDTLKLTILEPDTLIITEFIYDKNYICALETSPNVYGWIDGSAKVRATGGTLDYTFNWESSGETDSSAVALVADNMNDTTQVVYVTDKNGCVAKDSLVLYPNDTILVSLKIVDPIKCNGDSTAIVTFDTLNGGTPNTAIPFYEYFWSNSSINDTINKLPAGTYSVIVTDALACTQTDSIVVTEPAPIIPALTDKQLANCYPFADSDVGSIMLSGVSGGNLPYSFQWYDGNHDEIVGETNDTIKFLSAGQYFVLISDIEECSKEYEFSLGAIDSVDVSIKRIVDGTYSSDGYVCKDSLITLSAQTVSLIDPAYQWFYHATELENNGSLMVHGIDSSITFTLKVMENINANGCYVIDQFDVTRYPMMNLDLGPELRKVIINAGINLGDSVSVVDTLVAHYQWAPSFITDMEGSDTTKNPRAFLTTDAIFTLTATSIYGCGETDTVRVNVITNVKPPTAFSPNGDGIYDTWQIMSESNYAEFPDLEVFVFNRWGIKVFHSKGEYNEPWDGKSPGGKDLPTGTYYYIVNFNKENLKPVTGSVTIIK